MKLQKYIIAILMVVTGYACTSNKSIDKDPLEETRTSMHEESDQVELTPLQYQIANVQLGDIKERNLSDVVQANGVIDIPPSNLLSVSAPLGGFVRKTNILQGMKVKKGQILATIENPDFIQIQQEYLETASEMSYAEMEMNRQAALSKENVTALKVYQQATTKYNTLKARLSGLKARLKIAGIQMNELEKGNIVREAHILAPSSGSVTTVNVNVGKFVNPTDVMFEIVDTDHLHVELFVFEKDISKVKIGQLVRFVINDNKGVERLAKIHLINPKIDQDRTVRVHCHLEQVDNSLWPDNYLKATIETGTVSVPALPDQAIVDYEGKSYIFYENGTEKNNGEIVASLFQMYEIKKGVSENGFTQVILPSTAPQRKVVLQGAYALLAKMKNQEGGGH
jgi:cobalt-zinc-cadmium efflux system membrane fusion protein